MKRLNSFFATAVLLFAAGCGGDSGADGGTTPGSGENDGDSGGSGGGTVPTYEIVFEGGDALPAPVLESDGAGVSVTVGFTSAAEWNAEKDATVEWLTLTPASGAAGHAELMLTAEPNMDYEERNASVTITSGTVRRSFTVTQKQKNALTLTSDKVEMTVDGGSFEVEYQTNTGPVECQIEAAAESWLSKTETRALESGSQTFFVTANESKSSREGRITLKAGALTETVTVYQSGMEPCVILSGSDYTVPAEGGTVRIELQSNVAVTAGQPSATWIQRVDTRAMSSYTYNYKVDAYEGSAPRSATIEFTADGGSIKETVTVTQNPAVSTGSLFKWPNNEATDGIVRAFPGAEGGGMFTTGGRGGRVIHVTNLNNSGEGSLRAAINEKGARIIVFDVAGTIELTEELKIGNGDLTIAGQTAPGDGICLKDYTVRLDASNVIIRYIRFRLGDKTATQSSPQEDCIWGRYKDDIILDHCTMTWSIDECASFYANRNFTMQWCLVGESMNNSGHAKGSHGYGGIWGGKNASFHHNLLVHNKSRNARIDHPQIYGNFLTTHRGNVDYRNNVIYNWGDNNTYGGEGGWFNFVGNYYKPGPASKDRKYFIDANGYYESGKMQYDYPRLYLDDNVHTKYHEFAADQTAGVYLHDGTGAGDPANMYLSAPLPIKKNDTDVCYTTTHSAGDAYEKVLAYVGVSHRRDAVDAHIVYDARNGVATYPVGSNGSTNGIIDSQKDVGGWPVLMADEAEIARVHDSDGDGIPDYYEKLFGLDPENPDDGAGHTFDDRYTNLEMYLHYLVQDTVAAQVAGGVNTELK